MKQSLNKAQVMSMMSVPLDDKLNMCVSASPAMHYSGTTSDMYKSGAWGFWQDGYYPSIIRESYPVYVKERSEDKGKQAFEIIKMLQDKKLLKLDKVSDFIEAMDVLIKIL